MQSKKGTFSLLIVVGIIVLVVAAAFFLLTPPVQETIPSTIEGASTSLTPPTLPGTSDALKTQLSKAKYLKEVFSVNREKYDLFESASIYRNESLEQTKQFFFDCCDITNEEDIFLSLPPIPADFAEVAYDLQIGRLYQIGTLGPGYYKQPEFYFNGLETAGVNRNYAFKAWSQPNLQYWGDYGMLTYPNKQFDTVSLSGRKTFTATVFVTNGWNIQNYVGINLVAGKEGTDFFDLKIAEDQTGQPYFLLGPTFPKYSSTWATKVVIEGTVKPNTPPGVYTIGINPITPPKELNEKWADDYSGLYTPYGFLTPSGNYIDLEITVTE
ncbi:MAG: hypothetical protein V1776_00040 [Candidatus Diapherotrites archaeon]